MWHRFVLWAKVLALQACPRAHELGRGGKVMVRSAELDRGQVLHFSTAGKVRTGFFSVLFLTMYETRV